MPRLFQILRRHPFLYGWLALLAASHLARAMVGGGEPLPAGVQSMALPELVGGRPTGRSVPIAWRERPAAPSPSPVPVLLVHGSLGAATEVAPLVAALADDRALLVPDLPGFGAARAALADYSQEAAAGYLAAWLERLDLPQVDVVAVSQGSGAALQLAELAPRRVRSLTLISAVGVEERTLLGEHHLNRALYALQRGLVLAADTLLPHFGLLDHLPVGRAYARSFTDSDQRPLRGLLERFAGPALIVHGDRDGLVPLAAAEETARLLPQSELVVLAGRHLLVASAPAAVAARLASFLDRVDRGTAPTRATAARERIAAAAEPAAAHRAPPARGLTLLLLLTLLALATLVSEDLACIGTGLMVARGALSFWTGSAACLVGIYVGDLLLYAAGRFLGRPALARPPLSWFVSPAAVERATAWFRRQGMRAVVISRFVPGTRLPTYVAAGIAHSPFGRFALVFFVASVLWTPLLVGLATIVGVPLLAWLAEAERFALPLLAAGMLALLVGERLLLPVFTWRGRRLLLSRWRRATRWEFWPLALFNIPVVAYVLFLGLRRRSPTLFTAANPAIPASGFVLESKSAILAGLAGAPDRVARFRLIPAGPPAEERLALARRAMSDAGLDFPVVVKPDVGERGQGVAVVRNEGELATRLAAIADAALVQEYVPGEELGVFYVRLPSAARGRIFSITAKELPVVVGDGRSTLEELILADDRAVCMARFFLDQHAPRLADVPAAGERVTLGEIGNHCRGTVFRDGNRHATPELAAAIDEVSRGYAGFFFGRYDLRVPSIDDLRAGRGFKVLELNGVTSEATHIYEPGASLLAGWRTLFAQWRLAFAIGAENVARGAAVVPLGRLLRMLLEHRRRSRT